MTQRALWAEDIEVGAFADLGAAEQKVLLVAVQGESHYSASFNCAVGRRFTDDSRGQQLFKTCDARFDFALLFAGCVVATIFFKVTLVACLRNLFRNFFATKINQLI